MNPPNTSLPPSFPKHVHILGIGGIGLSGVALLFHQRGAQVTGSDLRESPIIEMLRTLGVPIHIGPQPTKAAAADCWVHPDGLSNTHPEWIAAAKGGATLMTRDEALSLLCKGRDLIAVIGTHGRGLTAAILQALLAKKGAGGFAGILRADGSPHALDGSPMIVEFDERRGLPAKSLALLTTEIDPRPLGFYPDLPQTLSAIQSQRLSSQWSLQPLTLTPDLISYEVRRPKGPPIHLTARLELHLEHTAVTLEIDGQPPNSITLPPGRTMAQSLCAAAAFAHAYADLDLEEILQRAAQVIPLLTGHLEPVSKGNFPAFHDARTYPAALQRTLDEVHSLNRRHPAVLLRPYPPTFDAVALKHFVQALHRTSKLFILPDYWSPADTSPPRARALLNACLNAGISAALISEKDLPHLDLGQTDALIAFGGDDLRAFARIVKPQS